MGVDGAVGGVESCGGAEAGGVPEFEGVVVGGGGEGEGVEGVVVQACDAVGVRFEGSVGLALAWA